MPLTGATLDTVSKKEKVATDFAFAINGAASNKKWRTVFCAESEESVQRWKEGVAKSIDLASSAVFGTTIEDACFKANQHLPTVVEACVLVIERRTPSTTPP